MESVKAICFDLFHTLVDVNQAPDDIGIHTADLLNIDRRKWSDAVFSDLHEIRKPSAHFEVIKTLAHSIDADIPLDLLQTAVAQRQARFDWGLRHVQTDFLRTLAYFRQRNLKMALISNASTAEVRAWQDSPLSEYLQPAIFSCEAGCAKPEKLIYQMALDALAVSAEQCLFVGDGGSHELEGAKEIGMQTVMVTGFVNGLHGDKLDERRQYCDYELADITQLAELIDT